MSIIKKVDRKQIPIDIERELYSKSAGLCNMCKKLVVGYGQSIAEKAHICAFSDNENAPRANKDYAYDNSISNLILLCPNCHTTVDKYPELFPVEHLRCIKIEHENKVANLYNNEHNQFIKDINKLGKLQEVKNALYKSLVPCIHGFREICELANLESNFLVPNYPKFYPLKDVILNTLLNNVFIKYKELKPFLIGYYDVDQDTNCFRLNKQIDNVTYQNIENLILQFHHCICDWLYKCRENNLL